MTINVSRPPSFGKLAIGFDAENNRWNKVEIRDDQIFYDKWASRLEASFVDPENLTPAGDLAIYPYCWDLHRYLGRIWEPFNDPVVPPMNHEFSGMVIDAPQNIRGEVVKQFVEQYGDLFTYEVASNDFKLRTTADWRNEWQLIGKAALELDTFTPEGINEKLAEFADPAIELDEEVKGASLVVRPKGWAGFCWGLIARDKYDGITYERCGNLRGCIRELPSIRPFGSRGRKQKFCSNRCKMAERAERQKGTKEDKKIPLLSEIAAAFEEFNDREKEAKGKQDG